MGGGKGGTSTSQVQIPPEVLARYNSVNARAEEVAKTPFQAYGGEFVAPVNEVQQQGISQTQQYSQAAQPYYARAAGMTEGALQAAQPLTAAQIQQYQNPYIQSVVDPTLKALQQQQGIDRAGLQTQAIKAGAFGGDRAGVQRSIQQGQQELAQSQAISPLYADAYKNALATAQQQQGVGVQTGLQAGQQYAGIGTGAQQAGLQGGQAVIGAGTLGQQTQQAQDTAKYQQFLQQRGYDFQTAQFLANIAEGTGALSGSTTTTTQPTSFFSDERLKHDIKKIGKTNDGQPIYSFKYNGDDRTQIGLLAQEVEKKHPDAVGLSGGYKTVDYAKATAGARHARAMGGLVPESMGGAVFEPGNFARGGYVGGGLVTDPNDIQAILAAQKQSMGPFGQSGLYGGSSQQDPHGAVSGYVPKATLPVPKLVTSSFQPKTQQTGGLQTAMQDINSAGKTAEMLSTGYDAGKRGLLGKEAVTDPKTGDVLQKATSGAIGAGGKYDIDKSWFGDAPAEAHGGGIVPRHGFESGGMIDPYQMPTSGVMVPESIMDDSEAEKDKALKNAIKPQGAGGSKSSSGLGNAASTISSMYGAGKALSAAGSAAMEYLPMLLGLKDGGVVPRQGYQTAGTVPVATEGDAVPVATEGDAAPAPDFNRFVNRVFEFEGGLNPADTNGTPSLYGINQKAHPEFFENPSKEAAANIYKTQYWDAIGADKMPPHLAHVAADTAVIAGPTKAMELVQQAGNDPQRLLQLRKEFQDNLIAKDPAKYGKYENAWNTRLSTLAGDIGGQPQAQPQQQAAGVKPWYDKMAPRTYQGEDRTMGQFLTSKDFVIPLLTGLGTMASSPSRYLGSAILQGLGGGASAYQGVQKQQGEMEQQKVATAVGATNLAKNAVWDAGGGFMMVNTAQYGPMTSEKWMAMGQPDLIGGASKDYANALIKNSKSQKTGIVPPASTGMQPGVATSQPSAVVAPPIAPDAPTVGGITPSPEALKAAAAEHSSVMGVMNADTRKDLIARAQSVGQQSQAARDSAYNLTTGLNNLAAPLASMAVNKEIPPGVFANLYSKIINAANYGLDIADPKGQIGRIKYQGAQDFGDAQKAAANILQSYKGQLDQKTNDALEAIVQGTAEPSKLAEVSADVLAQNYRKKQEALEQANYTLALQQKYPNAGINASSLFKADPRYSPERFNKEQEAIKQFLLTPVGEEPMLNYMIGKGRDPELQKKMTPELVGQWTKKQYGVDLSPYFLSKQQ